MPFFLRKLFENVIHENEDVNTHKKRKTWDSGNGIKHRWDQDGDAKFQSHSCAAGPESYESASSRTKEAGKVSETTWDIISYI